jgi:hypothetical protein
MCTPHTLAHCYHGHRFYLHHQHQISPFHPAQ